jgi:hypothetical protein
MSFKYDINILAQVLLIDILSVDNTLRNQDLSVPWR